MKKQPEFLFQPSKNKVIITIVVAIFWTIALAILIYTAWYQNDYQMTLKFGDLGYYNRPLYEIADYFVNDGYLSLTSLAIPLVIIFFEELLCYFKKYFSKSKVFMFVWRSRKFLEYFAMIGWSIAMWQLIWGHQLIFSINRGFGAWFNTKTFVPPRINKIMGIVMFIVNNLVCWCTGIYVIHFLTNKPNFATAQYWKKTLYMVFVSALLYWEMGIVKKGTNRPLFYHMMFGTFLEDLSQSNHPEDLAAIQKYFLQDYHRYGWIIDQIPGPGVEGIGTWWTRFDRTNWINTGYQNLPGNWEWWKIFEGSWFNKNGTNPLTDVGLNGTFFEKDGAFPSGHLQSTLTWLIAVWVYTSNNSQTKKGQVSRYLLIWIGIGHNLLMFFALGLTYGHWMSDMVFTIVIAAPFHFLAVWMTKLTVMGVNKADSKIVAKFNKLQELKKPV